MGRELARCTAPVDATAPDRLCMALLPVEFKEIPQEGEAPARVDLRIKCPAHGWRGVEPAEFIAPQENVEGIAL